MKDVPNPLVQDQSYLRHFWHPVATLDELASSNDAGVGPIYRVLLDENILVAKVQDKIVAMADRCAHRFSK